MKNNTGYFLKLRKKIDKIDSKLLELFEKRALIINDVKKYKNSQKHKDSNFYLYIKPKREHEILSKIAKNTEYSSKFYYNTWRGIISASNFIEQDLNLLASSVETQYALYGHFGMQKAPDIEENSAKAMQLLNDDRYHIFAFLADDLAFWKELINQKMVKIFAKIESLSSKVIFICGKIPLEDMSVDAKIVTTQDDIKISNINSHVFITNYANNPNEEKILGWFYE